MNSEEHSSFFIINSSFLILNQVFLYHQVVNDEVLAFHGVLSHVELQQLLHGVAVHGAALQRDAHVGAGAVAQTLGIDVVAGPYDDARLDEALHALMDGRTRHAAYRGHVLKGNTRVTGNDFQYLLVQFVYFFHDVKLKCEFLDSSGFTFEKCVRVRIKQR